MTTTRKVPLTLDEHRAIGAQLYDIRTQLVFLSVWIGNAYRKAQMNLAVKAEKGIDRVRSRLDDYVAVEHPTLPHLEFCHVYYPGHVRSHETEETRWREWDVRKAQTATILMTRDLRLIADQLYPSYPVALGDRLLRAAEYIEAISINLPDWTPRRQGRGKHFGVMVPV